MRGIRVRGYVWGRPLVEVGRPVPLVGAIAFGIIDRGTNVLQVRPTTICPLSCIFCSVDAGPRSRWRAAEYMVEMEWLVEWVEAVAEAKSTRVEALIDCVGEGLTYPRIIELVRELKSSPWVQSVAIETHGAPLTKRIVDKLNDAGLDRVNLSIDTLNPTKARMLTGTEWYDVNRVREAAEYLVRETNIDLHVTPLWIPGINDDDVVKVVEWAISIGAGKRWPPVTIQKYVVHKHGRRVPGVREVSWREFWEWISRIEEKLGIKLRYTMEEWGMRYTKRLPIPYREGQLVRVEVIAPGWLKGEKLAVDWHHKRVITIVRAHKISIGDKLTVKVIRSKDNIVVAVPA